MIWRLVICHAGAVFMEQACSSAVGPCLLLLLISILCTKYVTDKSRTQVLTGLAPQQNARLYSDVLSAPAPKPGLEEAMEEQLKHLEGAIVALEQENYRLNMEIATVEAQEVSWDEELAHIREREARLKMKDAELKVMELSDGAMGARFTDEVEDFSTVLPSEPNAGTRGTSLKRSNCSSMAPSGDPAQQGGPLLWTPVSHKFLLALCVHGKMIHKEVCLRKYAALAALLNRTLVLAPAQVDAVTRSTLMDEWAVDTAAAQRCFGQRNIVPFVDMGEQDPAVPVRLLCWWHGCGREELCRQGSDLRALLPVGLCEAANLSTPVASLSDFLARYGSLEDKVISFGDIFHVEGFHELPHLFTAGANAPAFQMHNTCTLAIRPAASILEAAHQFIRMMIGTDFAAVHLLQADIWPGGCAEALEGCHTRVARLASCVVDRIRTFGKELTTVFLATNAKPSEVLLLKSHLEAHHKSPLHVTTLLPLEDGVWAAPLGEWKTEPGVVALLEEVVCAMSPLFVAYRASTFTSSIQRLRIALQSATCHDSYECSEV